LRACRARRRWDVFERVSLAMRIPVPGTLTGEGNECIFNAMCPRRPTEGGLGCCVVCNRDKEAVRVEVMGREKRGDDAVAKKRGCR
jgi:hypothetical protein